MYDKDFLIKKDVVSNGYDKDFSLARSILVRQGDFEPMREFIMAVPTWDTFRVAANVSKSQRKRYGRVYARIKRMLDCGADTFFITLTFNEGVLSSTTKETRRRYVSRFLRCCFFDYVANIDYGSSNGREHYHCVVASMEGLKGVKALCNENYGYGFTCVERIGKKDKDGSAVSRYVVKLARHAVKHGALDALNRSCMIYKR